MTERQIYLIGLNHRTAGVEVRERFALATLCTVEAWPLPLEDGLEEALILSTCNRVEILACGTGDKLPETVLRLWAQARNEDPANLVSYVYIHKDLDAIHHLFSVASSLDSLVLGEPQILGQIKEAYRKALGAKKTGVVLNRLLHKAFSVAKRVRTETAVASSAVSISYAAVELAKRIFGDMNQYQAMLIGAGEMAELAAAHLLQAGIKRMYVANRTFENAKDFVSRLGADTRNLYAVPFEDLTSNLVETDIIISSTGSPDPIIYARDLDEVLKRRKYRPMFFIDIAVPRDIAPDVNSLDNVYLYDIDDLKEVVEENLAHRRDKAEKAKDIVREEAHTFERWLQSLELQPTIIDIIQRGHTIAQLEIEKTCKRLGAVDEQTREALEAMAHAIVNKLNHAPITFLKEQHCHNNELNSTHMDIARRMLHLDNEPIHGRCPFKK